MIYLPEIDSTNAYAATLLPDAEAGTVVRWHFMGRIQTNKVGRLAHLVALWHGVDRIEAGRAIARHRPGAAVLVQVDCSGHGGGDPPAVRRVEIYLHGN